MIIAVKIDFGNDKAIILSQVAKDRRSNFSFGDAIKTDFGMLSFCENSEIANYKAPFEYVNDCLRIKETVHYTCDCKKSEVSIDNQDNKSFNYSYTGNEYYNFQFVNYLGHSKIKVDEFSFPIEVVPLKMNYEEDYIKLTEAIAQKCSALLLDCSGITYHTFEQQSSDANLLEQFIFLREFCNAGNLESLFESIKQNPDRLLEKEEILKPFGQGVPSQKFYSNPFSYSRSWQNVDGKYLPQEISVTRKYDSLDTPANRFLKLALNKFAQIASELKLALDSKSTEEKQVQVYKDAQKLLTAIEDILNDSFFDDVSDLEILPQNNQVLQKREGYAQIFNAFSMVDLALNLNWNGQNDVYKGEAKNVATLYEYWLFFELYDIINSIEKNEIKDNAENAIKINEGKLEVSLAEGNPSCQQFEIKKYQTKVNLYYNKTFSSKDFNNTDYQGSYSRPFRPDYTLAVFPDVFDSENDAIKAGEVSFIHFDAKYRITDLRSFIGQKDDGSKITEEEEIQEEKKSSITNTYQRGDLLKMHTYNDAIRRTIGSYVLYPGDSQQTEMTLYEEILPGVGAFAIRPSIKSEREGALQRFISQLIEIKSLSYSRLNRMEFQDNLIIQEPSYLELQKDNFRIKTEDIQRTEELDKNPAEGVHFCIGFIRSEYFKILQKTFNGLFYFYQAMGNRPLLIHSRLTSCTEFIGYLENSDDCIRGKIVGSLQVMNKYVLKERLNKFGYQHEPSQLNYYCLNITDIHVVKKDSLNHILEKVDKDSENRELDKYSPKVVSF